ncbi:MAG: tetratricopeptide repeat protein, partial [Bacteroidota bacterium]
ADSYTLLRANGYFSPKDSYPLAKEAAAKALELDDRLAEAHNSMALVRMFYDWDWSGAEREFKRALELNPGLAGAHHSFAVYLIAMGRFDEAIAEIKRAQELDPLSLPINSFVGWVHYFAGNNDEAIEQYKKTLGMDPNFPLAHFYLGWAYTRKSMHQEAKAVFEKAISLSGHSWGEMTMRGIISAFSDRKDEAQKILDELLALSKQRYVCPQCVAGIYTALDQKDQAFEWLEKAYEEHSSDLIFLKVHKGWDNIRSDGRFIALLKKVGLE